MTTTYERLRSAEGIELNEGDLINDGYSTYKILHIYDVGNRVILLEREMMEDGSFLFVMNPSYRSFADIGTNFTVIVKQ